MECPICLEDVTPKELGGSIWKKKYKCPNCNKPFSKKTFLRKATGFAGNVLLVGLVGDALGDGNIDGNFSDD